MKMSTVTTIEWIGIVGFWTLLISDIMTPGEQHPALAVARIVFVFVIIGASFYKYGFRAALKKNNIYETSN